MTFKLITYSGHALQRMEVRGITRPMVRGVLATGLWQREQYGRVSKRAYVGRRELKVAYLEEAHEIHVVTVMWTDEKPAHERVGGRET